MLVARMFSLTRCRLPYYCIKSTLHTSGAANAKVAVVLSGCGVYDGSEIHEASAVMVHLSRSGAQTSIFAPNMNQMHTIDHHKGVPMEPNRNVLVESARIARGAIEDLSKLCAKDFDAVIFPGGFGAAKNLSTFAVDGAHMKVNREVELVLKDFHCAKKPIGLICIAPVLAAKLFPGCEVTVGSDTDQGGKWPNAEAAVAIQCMKSYHIEKDVTECHVDCSNKIVTTPAFMCNTAIHNIFDGIGVLVKNVLELVK